MASGQAGGYTGRDSCGPFGADVGVTPGHLNWDFDAFACQCFFCWKIYFFDNFMEILHILMYIFLLSRKH